MRLTGLFSLFIFLGVGSAQVFAAQDDISVKVEVDKAFATIGDQINFRVTIRHHPSIMVLEANAERALSDFEIKKTTDFSTRDNNIVSEGKNYVITTYLLGEYVIRPFLIQYKTKDGTVKEIQTNSLYITMESVDKNKDENAESDIRGVKGVHKLKNRVFRWFLWLVFTGAAVFAGAWFYLYRKRQRLTGQPQEPVLSAHEEAYLALNQLKHSDLVRKGLVKQYFFQMSEILRRYLERRFRIRALESTTYELMQELTPVANRDQVQLIQEVLDFCDLVKFAKYEPAALEVIQETNRAKTVIDQTKEEPEPIATEIKTT